MTALVQMSKTMDAPDRVEFFGGITEMLEQASHTEHLMEPFMILSTSAFRGFELTPPEAMVLDEVLEIASQMSEVLARGDGSVH